jgi:hypothetical protein
VLRVSMRRPAALSARGPRRPQPLSPFDPMLHCFPDEVVALSWRALSSTPSARNPL